MAIGLPAWFPAFATALLVGPMAAVAEAQDAEPVYSQTFEGAEWAADFACTDPAAWRADRGSLWQFAQSTYRPAHRSPLNMAIVGGLRVGAFVLEADLMQTGREYSHRDMCLVFAFQDPEHFCYAHLSSGADENAHGIFVVDGADRTPITSERSRGVDWGRDAWHKLRAEFDADARSIRVLLDGDVVLASDAVPFESGCVGFGTFDDEGRIDNVRIWSEDVQEIASGHFEPPNAAALDSAVRFEQLDDRIRVSLGDKHFADYVHTGVIHPYVAPVRGPRGMRMTRAYPMEEVEGEAHDHPHHTGLWWAHGDINGVDTWHQGGMDLTDGPDVSGSSIIAAYCVAGPQGPTGMVVQETLTFAETLSGDRIIDVVVVLAAPSDADLVLGDTKEGTMAIRTHPALRLTPDPGAGMTEVTGVARNSEGVQGKGVWGKRAAWIDYSGIIDGNPVGVAIFDHPSNPRFPTWWHARDYGLIAANPFGQSDFEGGEPDRGRLVIPPGSSVCFRYRFLFHRFDANGARVADAYAQWTRHEIEPGVPPR